MSVPALGPSARDSLLLEWSAQQYGVSIPTLAIAAGVRLRRAYDIAKRWKLAGWANVARIDVGSAGPWRRSNHFDDPTVVPHGPLWVYPTRETAWGYLNFDPGEWRPTPSTLAHLTAVSQLRLALTGVDTDPEVWTSERLLRRTGKPHGGKPASHVHDAWFQDLTDPDKMWAIEVELTRKFGAGRLMRSVSAALTEAQRHKLAGVLYFVRGEVLRNAVQVAASRLTQQRGPDAAASVEVHDLDETLQRKGVQG